MAGPNAAYAANVTTAPDVAGSPGSFTTVGGQLKFQIGLKGEALDVTTMNSAGYRMKAYGLLDGTAKLTCYSSYGDTGQGNILTSITTRARVWINATLNDSAHSIQMAMYPQKYSLSTDPSKVVPIDIPLVLDGTPASPVTIA